MDEQVQKMTKLNTIGAVLQLFVILFASVLAVSSQEENLEVTVTLELDKNVYRRSDAAMAKISVRNDGKEGICLVIPPILMYSYDLEKNALGLGLEFNPASEHAFVMPRLRRLDPRKTTIVRYPITFSSWSSVDRGHWFVDASVGTIKLDRLCNKHNDEPCSDVSECSMSREDFLRVQELSYSSGVRIEIQ